MEKNGIIYILTTAVNGLIKIGKTGVRNYEERMRFLESNGYYNVVGLKRYFAIEVEEYSDKEGLLHEIFAKHRVGESELFALDYELVKQLLLSFEGRVIYPKMISKENEFDLLTKTIKKENRFSFYRKGLKNGDEIVFIKDKNIKAKVVGEKTVEYLGQIWKLSPLAKYLFEARNEVNNSGAYQGAAFFIFKDKKLKDLADIK